MATDVQSSLQYSSIQWERKGKQRKGFDKLEFKVKLQNDKKEGVCDWSSEKQMQRGVGENKTEGREGGASSLSNKGPCLPPPPHTHTHTHAHTHTPP